MIDIRIQDLFHKAAYGVWIIKRDLQSRTHYIAKPTELFFEKQDRETFILPEPTFEIRAEEALEYAKAFLEAYEKSRLHNKEPINTKQVEAMSDNLKDLRSVVDRLFMVIQK